MNELLRAAMAGWATGDRSFSALSVWLARPATVDAVPRPLRSTRVARTAALAAVGELVGDKLPMTPARTSPPALAWRLACAGMCGVVLGRRTGAVAASTAVAVAVAAASSFAGPPARAALAGRFGSDLPGALAEDVMAYGLAYAAMRP